MKKFVLALVLASSLVMPRPAYADGCNSISCTSTGWFTVYYFPFACSYVYTEYYNGGWNYYDSCGGSSTGGLDLQSPF